jgi:hypothetical protein
MYKGKPVQTPSERLPPDNIDELIKIRLIEGIAKSLEYAGERQKGLIMEITKIPELIDENEKVKFDKLSRLKNFYIHYQNECSNQNLYIDKEYQIDFFSNLVSDAKEGSKGNWYRYHQVLVEVEQHIKNNDIFEIISFLANKNDKINKINDVKDQHMRIFIEKMAEFSDYCKKQMQFINSTDRQKKQAIIDLNNKIESVYTFLSNTLEKIENKSEIVPEISLFTCQMKGILRIARNEHIRQTDKPVFMIELHPPQNEIFIDAGKGVCTISFSIHNTSKENIVIDKVKIIPKSHSSSDLWYKGNEKELHLIRGEQLFDITFHTNYQENSEYDENPLIMFTILYKLLNHKFEIEYPFTLPRVHPNFTITNPFEEGVGGIALEGSSNLFTGREEVLKNISSDFLNFSRPAPCLLLVGLPRSGKTSLLNQLAQNQKWHKNKLVPISISAQATQEAESFFHYIYTEIEICIEHNLEIHVQKPETLPKNAPTWQKVQELLRRNESEIIKKGKRLLLIIDEYQNIWKTDKNTQKTTEKLFKEFPDFIKVIQDHHSKIIGIVLCGYESLMDSYITESDRFYWVQQLGGRIKTDYSIFNLPRDEANELIQNRFSKFNINISPSLLDKIYCCTQGNPYLHVLLGYHLFNIITDNCNKSDSYKTLRLEDIEMALDKITVDQAKIFYADPWAQRKKEACIFLLALAEHTLELTDGHPIKDGMPFVAPDRIKDYLYRVYKIEHSSFEFKGDNLEILGHYKFIEKSGDEYKLTYSLLPIVVKNNNIFLLAYRAFYG